LGTEVSENGDRLVVQQSTGWDLRPLPAGHDSSSVRLMSSNEGKRP
jgi:hypothetical protein